jgi:hypothetical protein
MSSLPSSTNRISCMPYMYTSIVIRFVSISAKFGICTVVVSIVRTLVKDKMLGFKGECAQFRFNNCPFYTHDGPSAKFSTNSHETETV